MQRPEPLLQATCKSMQHCLHPGWSEFKWRDTSTSQGLPSEALKGRRQHMAQNYMYAPVTAWGSGVSGHHYKAAASKTIIYNGEL